MKIAFAIVPASFLAFVAYGLGQGWSLWFIVPAFVVALLAGLLGAGE